MKTRSSVTDSHGGNEDYSLQLQKLMSVIYSDCEDLFELQLNDYSIIYQLITDLKNDIFPEDLTNSITTATTNSIYSRSFTTREIESLLMEEAEILSAAREKITILRIHHFIVKLTTGRLCLRETMNRASLKLQTQHQPTEDHLHLFLQQIEEFHQRLRIFSVNNDEDINELLALIDSNDEWRKRKNVEVIPMVNSVKRAKIFSAPSASSLSPIASSASSSSSSSFAASSSLSSSSSSLPSSSPLFLQPIILTAQPTSSLPISTPTTQYTPQIQLTSSPAIITKKIKKNKNKNNKIKNPTTTDPSIIDTTTHTTINTSTIKPAQTIKNDSVLITRAKNKLPTDTLKLKNGTQPQSTTTRIKPQQTKERLDTFRHHYTTIPPPYQSSIPHHLISTQPPFHYQQSTTQSQYVTQQPYQIAPTLHLQSPFTNHHQFPEQQHYQQQNTHDPYYTNRYPPHNNYPGNYQGL